MDNRKNNVFRYERSMSIKVYQIADYELKTLEEGHTGINYLNFGTFFLSIGFTAIAALLTSEFKFNIAKSVFYLVAILGPFLSLYFIFKWWQAKRLIHNLILQIIRENTAKYTSPPS